jgi:lipopolysaccharide assembly outer membrane protein LptD (OstA)
LKDIEGKQIKMQQAQATTDHEREIAKIEITKQYDEYLALLDTQKMHEEYDRKDDLVITQGNINMAMEAGKAGLVTDDGSAMMEYEHQRNAAAEDSRIKEKEIDRKQAADRAKNQLEDKKIQAKYKEIEMKERVAKVAAQIKKTTAKK